MGVPVRQPVSDPVAMVRRLNARAYHPRKTAILPEAIPGVQAQRLNVNIYTVNVIVFC